MQFGMPAGFQAALDRKYGLLQQQNDTQRIAVNAAARLDNTRADLMPGESRANVANTNAQTTNLGLTGQTIIPLANANIASLNSGVRLNDANVANIAEETIGRRQINRVRPRSSYLGLMGLGGAGSEEAASGASFRFGL